MLLKLIVQEPKYQINIGYIARVAKNFGIRRIFFINPRADIRGRTALMYSKHARELLESAVVCRSLDEATADCNISVGTTGVWKKALAHFKNAHPLEDAIAAAKRLGRGRKTFRIGLIIGRDDIGMMKEELERCDMVCSIEADQRYPVLNVSHALAILLYEFTRAGFKGRYAKNTQTAINKGEVDALFGVFGDIVKGKRIRNREAVNTIFRKLILSSDLNMREIHALITALK